MHIDKTISFKLPIHLNIYPYILKCTAYMNRFYYWELFVYIVKYVK